MGPQGCALQRPASPSCGGVAAGENTFANIKPYLDRHWRTADAESFVDCESAYNFFLSFAEKKKTIAEDTFQQAVAADKQTRQDAVHNFVVAHNHAADLFAERIVSIA